MIKVIAFDYADVIAQSPLSKWVRENLSKEDDRYNHYKKHSPLWDTGQMTTEKFYQTLSEVTGISPNLIWEKFYENRKPDKEVVNIIKKLKKNYKIILFSNFLAELLRKLLVQQKIEKLFDEIIISSEHKLAKPDPDFFDLLIKKSQVKKDEILFIDDRIENVSGANDMGIKSMQFINSETLTTDLKKFLIKV